jgi:probable F420-dependent oxidoreductase
MDLGRVGVWSGQFMGLEPSAAADAAAAIEALGYGTVWIPGGAGGDVLDRCDAALGGSERLAVATGILNVWRHDAAEVAASTSSLNQRHAGRFLLGIGVSHQRLIGDEYVGPLAKMTSYLDELDAAGQTSDVRVLAALRPRMLQLAKERAAGTHPYFVPPEHSAAARTLLGAGPIVAPMQAVSLLTDPTDARDMARRFCSIYLGLPNYTNNLRRLGYTDDDLTAPGSDRLVDAIVAWGTVDHIAARVRAHIDAGADHVCLQIIGADRGRVPVEELRELSGITR